MPRNRKVLNLANVECSRESAEKREEVSWKEKVKLAPTHPSICQVVI